MKDVTGGNVDIGGDNGAVRLPEGRAACERATSSSAPPWARATTRCGTSRSRCRGSDAYTSIAKQLTDAGFNGDFGAQGANGGGTGTFTNGTYGVLVVVTDAGSNGWVANYSVSKGKAPSPTPTAGC